MKDKNKWFKDCVNILCSKYNYDYISAEDLASTFDDEQIDDNTPEEALESEFSYYDGY